MLPEPVAGVAAHCCPACAGVWLAASDLRTLRTSSRARPRPWAQHSFVPSSSGPLFNCPACQTGVLQAGSVAAYQVMACNACRGIFLAALPRASARQQSASDTSNAPAPGELLLSLVEIGSALL